MQHLLILNPNTDPVLTEKLTLRARHLLPPDIAVTGATASFGAQYIACRASLAIAAHATLDTFARVRATLPRPGTGTIILVACFGDPGLAALADIAGHPVTGLARASLHACRARGGRTGILTGGAAWQPIIEDLLLTEGYLPFTAGVRTIAASGGQAAHDRHATIAALRREADILIRQGADRILIAGAGLVGFSAVLAADLPVPVHCSVDESLRRVAAHPPDRAPASQPAIDTKGLAPDLTALLAGQT